MSGDRLPVGPYKELGLESGKRVPYYIMPFDKNGVSRAPETYKHLIKSLTENKYSDVYLFSHGWNNDWTVATNRYQEFIEGFVGARKTLGINISDNYKPLLIGIFWPSTSLVVGAKERGPGFSSVGIPTDVAVTQERQELDELSAGLDPHQSELLYGLAQRSHLTEEEANQLAELAATLGSARSHDELGEQEPLSAAEIRNDWDRNFGEVDVVGALSPAGRNTAGTAGMGSVLTKLDPRELIRVMTVAMMKDRAAVVGRKGVGPLLRQLVQSEAKPKVHLVGHSYGAQVVLAATCESKDWVGPKIRSMLLLQPAVSHLCFSETLPGSNKPGGYRTAMDRVDSPILSTFSKNDVPLTKVFHLALRRDADLGEQRLEAIGSPPNKYAALGGYGPIGKGCEIIKLNGAGVEYEFRAETKVYGLDGSELVKGHGEISTPETWWALQTLVSR